MDIASGARTGEPPQPPRPAGQAELLSGTSLVERALEGVVHALLDAAAGRLFHSYDERRAAVQVSDSERSDEGRLGNEAGETRDRSHDQRLADVERDRYSAGNGDGAPRASGTPVPGDAARRDAVRAHVVRGDAVRADAVRGEHVAGVCPGPELVSLLDAMDAQTLDAAELVEGIAAWERVLAWSAARQAVLVRAFANQELSSRHLEFAGDEIAARLSVTRTAADAKIALADVLDDHPEVGTLLADGSIDVVKVRIIGEEMIAVPQEGRDAVLAGVVAEAPELTGPLLRNRLRKGALAADPSAAARRAERERSERRVTLTPAADAMAWLSAYLPADAAMACYTALDALAATSSPDDPRRIDARRADALTDVLRSVLDSGVGPYGSIPTQQRRRPHIQVTVAAGTLLGLDDAPADLAGYGPIPADMARAIAQDGTWRRILLDEGGGVCARGDATYRPGADLASVVVARDATCTFPGCRIPAWRCDLDHVEPFDPARPAQDQTTRDNIQALCRHHHRLKTETSWKVSRDPATGTTTWVSPLGNRYDRQPYRPPGPPGIPTEGRRRTDDMQRGSPPITEMADEPRRPPASSSQQPDPPRRADSPRRPPASAIQPDPPLRADSPKRLESTVRSDPPRSARALEEPVDDPPPY